VRISLITRLEWCRHLGPNSYNGNASLDPERTWKSHSKCFAGIALPCLKNMVRVVCCVIGKGGGGSSNGRVTDCMYCVDCEPALCSTSSDIKRLGRKADDALPCSAGVKSEWRLYLQSLMYLRGAHSDIICCHLVRCIKGSAAETRPFNPNIFVRLCCTIVMPVCGCCEVLQDYAERCPLRVRR
jgi:hypothetical protein